MKTMEYSAQHGLDRLAEALRKYPVEKMAAAVRAQNRTMSALRAEAARRLQPDLAGMKIGTIKRQLKQTRATASNARAILEFSAKRFGLVRNVRLNQIATKWGTGARLGKMPFRLELADGTPVTPEQLKRLFIQRSHSGKVNVWVREGRHSRPFQAVVVAGVAAAYRARNLAPRLMNIGRERMAIVLEQEFKYRLSKGS
jgi:hypothetical protein